jgi:hypothetical protein
MILILSVVLLLSAVPASVCGQAWPDGPVFQVNAYSTGDQGQPVVAAAADGSFVVVWWDGDGHDGDGAGLFGQRFDSSAAPVGGEFQVNTYTTGNQGVADVAMAPDGKHVVVWSSYLYSTAVIVGQRYDSAGTPLDGEFEVTTGTSGVLSSRAVAMDANGNFTVVWSSGTFTTTGKDGSKAGVFGQNYDSAGTPVGAEFQVNTYTTEVQHYPVIAMEPAGSFVVVWMSTEQDGDQGGIFGQRYDSGGAPAGGEFQVNTYTKGFQFDPDVVMDAGGNFVLVWVSTGQVGRSGNRDVFGQRYDNTGTVLGNEFRVGLTELLDIDQDQPAVTADPDGNFVVAWKLKGSGLSIRRYDSAGLPQNHLGVGGSNRASQRTPQVAAAADGNFVVVWAQRPTLFDSLNILGRRFAVSDIKIVVPGKKLLIKNKVPDDPEKNKAIWLAKWSEIVAGAAGTANDPRCNSDPPGTEKATLRFFSPSSGQDTGEIGLPCQNWGPIHASDIRRGYKYTDRELDDGPCKRVLISSGRRLGAKCFGRGPTTDFPYDLTVGTDEDVVNVVLSVGEIQYCTAFEDFKGRDGSDGKKFQGRDAPAPLSCPEASSPSGAFLDTSSDILH